VPASALISFAGIDKVLSVKDGKSVERRVQTGRRDGARVEILDGVGAGDLVVVEPGNLAGGQAVTVTR
jgi:multidrug efflux pump subunit AcrA (membrane-fusion protein)